MNTSRFLASLWSNKLILLVVIGVYVVLFSASYALRAERPKAPPVDVVFVFDATGSMQDKIDGLLEISSRFAAKLASTGSDYRLAMVTFGAAEEPQVIRQTFESSSDLAGFQEFLKSVVADGGGSEDQPTAIKYALSHFTYRPKARKILILVTDEPLLGAERQQTGAAAPLAEWDSIIGNVAANRFTAYSVCLPEEPFQALSDRTGGKFYDIQRGGDFTDILMNIAQRINASLTR